MRALQPDCVCTGQSVQQVRESLDQIYRSESRHILATLIRLLSDFDLAEDALHDAFRAAMEKWPAEGVPANPRAWLISTGRFKALDSIRRHARLGTLEPEIAWELHNEAWEPLIGDEEDIEDDRLRLIFTCCHPALAE